MQEEVTQKTIALCIRTTKLTADVLKAAMRAYLRSHNQKKQQKMQSQKTGKVTVKQLAKQNGGMTNIEITNKNIRSFERYARKYGINYALKKDKSKDPPVYINIINLRLDITHLYYPAKNSFQKGRLKRREIFTELLLYTLTT